MTEVVYAGFWRRFWALVIDFFVICFAAAAIGAATGGNQVGGLVTAFVLVYFVGLDVEGGTLGKRVLSLRVVRRDGTPLGVFHAFIREVVGKPISALALFGGFLWMLDNPQRQTWHDIIASSVVVRELNTNLRPAWSEVPPWQQQRVTPTDTAAPTTAAD